MGIIQKQAAKNTIIQMLGNAFGAITRLLMPIALSEAQIGLIQTLEYVSGSFQTIFSFGYNQILIRMFPTYRNEKNGHHGFLALGIILSVIGFFFSLIVFGALGSDFFVNEEDNNIVLVKSFIWLVIPRLFFNMIFYNLDGYSKMLFNSVIGAFLESLLLKVIFALSVILFYFNLIQFSGLVYLATIGFMMPGLIILIYSIKNTKHITLPKKSIFTGKNKNQFYQNMLFGILSGATGSLILYIDSYMVGTFISLKMLGIYATLYFAARLIIVPSRAINRIANAILAESWKEKDHNNILAVYQKSCINQLLIGGFLFVLGWGLIDSIMELSIKFNSYQEHLYVFFFLGIGTLVEMATGVNAGIIATSDSFKMNTYFNLILAFCIIVSNLVFIQLYGVEGAALASMIAMFIINFIRWIYLFKKYNLQPFDHKFLRASIFIVIFILLCHFVNFSDVTLWNVLSKGTLTLLLFWTGVYLFGFSAEINNSINKLLQILKIKSS